MKIVQLIILLTIASFQFNCNTQKINHVSLIFLKEDINSTDILQDIKDELFYNNLTDSITTSGIPYPVIVIQISREHLLRYGLTKEKVQEVVKSEFESSIINSRTGNDIIIKASDFEINRKYYSVDDIGNLAIEIIQNEMVIRLKDIAKIFIERHSVQNIYQGEEVEIISFKFLGKTRFKLEETLKSVEIFGLRYKIVVNQPNLKFERTE